jgi:hypothetical protein
MTDAPRVQALTHISTLSGSGRRVAVVTFGEFADYTEARGFLDDLQDEIGGAIRIDWHELKDDTK